jgi:alcohol dehydrogenase class IV
MTPIWGLTENGLKRTGRDERALPRVVIYDPLLTLDLSPAVSGPSGMNAIAHCVEALYSENANPLVSLMAEEGIRALAGSLPQIVRDPHDRSARAGALYGAWLAGTVLGAVGMALHHKLCHTLGGTFGLPHAETHAIVLPHVVQYNAAAASVAMDRVKRALGTDDAASGLYRLLKRVSAKTALKDIGMPAEGLKKAVAMALTNPYFNPAPLEEHKLHRLLSRAYEGESPQ